MKLTGHNQRSWTLDPADFCAGQVVEAFARYRKDRLMVARFMPILPAIPGKLVAESALRLDRAIQRLEKVARVQK